jgi:hypothetical protein
MNEATLNIQLQAQRLQSERVNLFWTVSSKLMYFSRPLQPIVLGS